MQCFEDVPGELISKEAFVCILALFYEFVEIEDDFVPDTILMILWLLLHCNE